MTNKISLYQNSNGIYDRNGKADSQVHMKFQEMPNSKSIWKNPKLESHSLRSLLTTKLNKSKQCGKCIRIDSDINGINLRVQKETFIYTVN